MKIIGITLGPILETISESRKIYEIANASAFFSTFMYEFLKKVTDSKKYEIITPYFKYEEKNKLYPDRAILKIETSDKNEKIYHFDVYRLSDIEEFYDMGGDEYYDRALCIIEWADIIIEALPDRYLKIMIEKEEDITVRKITIKYIEKG